MPTVAKTGRLVSPAKSWVGTLNSGPGSEQRRVHRPGNARRDDERHERASPRTRRAAARSRARPRRAGRRTSPTCRPPRRTRAGSCVPTASHPDQLTDQRSERAAGDDDRALGAERPTGPDRHRGRERLRDRGPRRDPALAGEHRLHRLGDAVPADHRRPLRQQRHHQPTRRRLHEQDRTRMEVGERRQLPPPLMEEHDVRDQADEVDEDPGRAAPGEAEQRRDAREKAGPAGLGPPRRPPRAAVTPTPIVSRYSCDPTDYRS